MPLRRSPPRVRAGASDSWWSAASTLILPFSLAPMRRVLSAGCHQMVTRLSGSSHSSSLSVTPKAV